MPQYRRRRYNAPRKGKPLNPKQKKEVKTLIARRQELKYYQQTKSGAVGAVAAISGLPWDIPQGIDDQARIGDTFQWCGTHEIRGQFINASGVGADTHNTLRYIVFQWHPDSAPTPADILLVGPSTNIDIHSLYNHDKRQQYSILLDRTITTIGAGTSADFPVTSNAVKTFHWKIPMGKKVTKTAQRVGGGLTGTNRIYECLMTDSTIAAFPVLNYAAKVFFRDS